MLLLAKIGVGFMGTILVGGAIVSSEGFIHVKVNEKQTNGTHVSFIVPAMIMPLAVRFVPRHDLRDASANMQQYMPVIDAAISGLADCADGTLVEVIDSDSHVTVVKSGGSIVVDADDPGETVHVAVPLRATKATLDEIAAANGPS
ncbi:MAG TPA: hypothetical protein VKB26_12265 [Candidatus Acidoferrales bacterium]|nr:hypothetical protein [Candidatus Acidoferrales bacterium]